MTIFPEDFAFGAASAAFQVEGACAEGGRSASVWDVFSRRPSKIFHGHNAAVACDHYNRWQEDVDLMAELGLRAYRLSVSWPRVMPEGAGKVNEEGLDFYSRLVDGLLAKGVTPWITLYHWDMPWALHRKGGWANPAVSRWFADYAALLASRLGDRVKHWITINEPMVFLIMGSGKGEHAPGEVRDYGQLVQMSHSILLAHGRAVQALRAASPQACQIGFAPIAGARIPATDSEGDIEAAKKATFSFPIGRTADDLWSPVWWFDPVLLGRYPEGALETMGYDAPDVAEGDMDTIASPVDFCGFNYYHAQRVAASANADGYSSTFDIDWPTTPEGLYWAGRFYCERYGKPMVVCENGLNLPDAVARDGRVADGPRSHYIREHLFQIRRALAEGCPFSGYFYWSFMDNFEWTQGYRPRFGLVHVDYQTQARTPKESAFHYREIIKTRGQSLDMYQRPREP